MGLPAASRTRSSALAASASASSTANGGSRGAVAASSRRRSAAGSMALPGRRGGAAIARHSPDAGASRAARAARRAMSDTERAAAVQADPSGFAALRGILRIRPFRRLWIVLGVASLGDWLGLLATSIFASDQVSGSTAKGLAFGGVIAVRLVPALLLGPIAGVLADRFDRRITMVLCDLVRFVLFASIPLA